ncbi:MAG: RNA methyltransferase [SAR324 cluster bacterium]|nr:RNA methyltransferase [SAR324 cluster bacterium]
MSKRSARPRAVHAKPAWEMLYGINPVEEALIARRRRVRRLYLKGGSPSQRLTRIRDLAAERGVSATFLPAPELEVLCGSAHHQGSALECAPLSPGEEAEALNRAAGAGAVTLALDQVEDPQNFGAVVRNCAGFGAAALVVPRHHSAPLSPAASKASAGTLESFPVYAAANLPRFLDACRKRGIWIAGTAESGETPLHRFDAPLPLLVVLGSEGRGLRPLVRAKCDYAVSISTRGGASLNVASAAAVLLYHLIRPAS